LPLGRIDMQLTSGAGRLEKVNLDTVTSSATKNMFFNVLIILSFVVLRRKFNHLVVLFYTILNKKITEILLRTLLFILFKNYCLTFNIVVF
ncbi:MAG: hypothetical protein ABF242_00785, partial [Flavobacteriales bacterium]